MNKLIAINNISVSADTIRKLAIDVEQPITGDGTKKYPIGIELPMPSYSTLWTSSATFTNNYTFTLSDSIDNYDELIIYGSAIRDNSAWYIDCQNRYFVDKGKINLCCSYYNGTWATASNSHILCNGTQMMLSGNSGNILSSFYMGQAAGSTSWAGGKYNNRIDDVHPYKIIGVKY